MIWPNIYLSEVKLVYKKKFWKIIFAVRVAVAGQVFFDVWVACEMGFNKAELWLMSLTLASFERLHGVDSKNDDDEVSAETATQMHLVR